MGQNRSCRILPGGLRILSSCRLASSIALWTTWQCGNVVRSATPGATPVIYRLLPTTTTLHLLYRSPFNHHYPSPYPRSPMSSPQPRQDLIQNAILFLQDPKTQSSPLTSKIEFLQAKGLNESEIQDALSRSSSSSSSQPVQRQSQSIGGPSGGYGYGTRYEMAPVPPKRDWRDLFVCLCILCQCVVVPY
jgi:hypothetical protein